MANARKCNRCKKCFDPLDIGEQYSCRFENPVFQNADDLKNSVVGFRLVPGNGDIFIDLCPDCAEKFLDFMAGRGFEGNDPYLEQAMDELRSQAEFWEKCNDTSVKKYEVLRQELETKEAAWEREKKELNEKIDDINISWADDVEFAVDAKTVGLKKALDEMKESRDDIRRDYDELADAYLKLLHEKELMDAAIEQDPEKFESAIRTMKKALLDAISDYPADKFKERLLAGLHEALFGVPKMGIKL